MHYNRISIALTFSIVFLVFSSPTLAARLTKQEIEEQFLYGWSESSSLILYGTVAAVNYQDDPKLKSPHVEVTVRIDSTQRGVPGNSMIRVRIDDELQSFHWSDSQSRIGESGVWFLHRVRQYSGREPRAYLQRYMNREEIESDPQYMDSLMKFVIQDTVNRAIKPNILNILSADRSEAEEAEVGIHIEYDGEGVLSSIEFSQRSDNSLFNDHVFDTVMQIHRRIRVPGQVKATEISIKRSAL